MDELAPFNEPRALSAHDYERDERAVGVTHDVGGRPVDVIQRRVLLSARRLFVDNGYAGTTVAAVADHAGVSPETIYLSLGGKRGLIEGVIDAAITVPDNSPTRGEEWWDMVAQLPDGCADQVRPMCSVATMEAVRARRPVRHARRVHVAPGSRGPVATILQLQATAGNRAVTGVLLQRRGASVLLDKPIALASPIPQVVDDELVPIGEAPGRFDGFAKRDDALAIAKRSPEVAVVVSDGTHYHVLRTSATTLGGKTATPKLPKGWTAIEVVEPTNVATTGEFRTAFEDATKLSGDDKIQAYRKLLVRGTHLEHSQTGWSPNKDRYEEGKVNVALWLGTAGRHLPAKVVPTGSDRLPTTAILIGNTPFSEGAASVRTTLLHESRHAYHRSQTLQLIEEWRTVRTSDTIAAWRQWLKAKAKKSAVPDEVYFTTSAATDERAGTASTETYSYLHGFMYRYRRDEAAAKDPATLDADATRALHFRMIELHGMGEFWESAGQDVQEETLDRLVAFAAGLSAHHREHLRRFMTTNAAGGGYAPKAFYGKLTARL